MKLAITGHVDHGKSTLIGRLLFDTDAVASAKIDELRKKSEESGRIFEFSQFMDHFREERERGITIETSQAFIHTARRRYTIIDTPGHVEYIRNMVSGTSQAESALLLVDAREGVCEQTRRHAFLLKLLGMRQVACVINKMDLIDYDQARFERLRAELEEYFTKIELKVDAFVPCSASLGENISRSSAAMPWYKQGSVLDTLDCWQEPDPTSRELRFPIQDSYQVDGKNINVGRLESGELFLDDRLRVLPDNQEFILERLYRHGDKDSLPCISAGDCVGFVTEGNMKLTRGQVLTNAAGTATMRLELKALLFWFGEAGFSNELGLSLACVTQEAPCSITAVHSRYDSSDLRPLEPTEPLEYTQVAEVTLRLAMPLLIDRFEQNPPMGRFILSADDVIVAGGIVL